MTTRSLIVLALALTAAGSPDLVNTALSQGLTCLFQNAMRLQNTIVTILVTCDVLVVVVVAVVQWLDKTPSQLVNALNNVFGHLALLIARKRIVITAMLLNQLAKVNIASQTGNSIAASRENIIASQMSNKFIVIVVVGRRYRRRSLGMSLDSLAFALAHRFATLNRHEVSAMLIASIMLLLLVAVVVGRIAVASEPLLIVLLVVCVLLERRRRRRRRDGGRVCCVKGRQ